jgi:DNA primase
VGKHGRNREVVVMDHKTTAESLMRDEGMDESSALAAARARLEASEERTEEAIEEPESGNLERRHSPETVDPPTSLG